MALHSELPCGTVEDKKRKMKTPLQLEVLERVFAEEKYPSEALRGRLSIQLGLSNSQLKMWFCHRRLKERKSKGEDEEHGSSDKSAPLYGHSSVLTSPFHSRRSEPSLGKGDQVSGKSDFLQDSVAAGRCGRKPDIDEDGDFENLGRKKKRHTTNSSDCQRIAEMRAVASVEAQLGEPLRLDSPCLGVEFDHLPAGAFSESAAPFPQSKRSPKGPVDSSSTCKPDCWPQEDAFPGEKTMKIGKSVPIDHGLVINSWSGSGLPQEYQFIPEFPTRWDGMESGLEKASDIKAMHVPQLSRHGLSVHRPMSMGNEGLSNACKLERMTESAEPDFSLQGNSCNNLIITQQKAVPLDHLLPKINFEAQYTGHVNQHHSLSSATSCHAIETLHSFDFLETSSVGNKREKCEQIRVAKDFETQRKRLEKELDREEISKRKKEEQLHKEREKEVAKLLKEKQREDERRLREKQREDERLLRERQRKDERLQQEAKRELERQERFLQKEAQRLEREREKEEARRLKEATRLKASIERATVRRIARECVEFIDDERLELLEAAATSQGLPSIYLLDGETLQGLDRYKDFLKRFPPSAVKMKKPVMTNPWVDSQQNLGNLFMVWRFLVAFADVLGLWPFTLDELVQAFHDHESRLLSELHMALFKTIVKDIQDMANASASGGAVNQYTAASTIGGGHTQLVEVASAWGFDYRNWSRHLNELTWPEVLRQFSLAAGYGGSIKKQHEAAELENDGHHVLFKSNTCSKGLKLGTTASNAAKFLKLRAGLHFRRAGSRLTPGTVKFAAFHVLSVEGSHGLTVSEIVARIEKYGLRDLSTSKTPEASVAAALSRDAMFFDRVAPSTYRVKPAYQKNPIDAEQFLQAAVERTRLFQSGILDACDDAKDIQGCDEGGKSLFMVDCTEEYALDGKYQGCDKGKVTPDIKSFNKAGSSGEGNVGDSTGMCETSEWHCEKRDKRGELESLQSCSRSVLLDEADSRAPKALFLAVDKKNGRTNAGEPWVQALCAGEYSGLSVEERLNALVALVETVNEGNTIRVALEDRMESATVLKRQMWAEAQLDKRRFKEEQIVKSLSHSGNDIPQGEGDITSSLLKNVKNFDCLSSQSDARKSPVSKEQCMQGYCYQDSSGVGVPSQKSRAQLKVDIDFRADELYVFRSLPLGLDRRRNRYWQFVASHCSYDPGNGRIFFESSEDGHWEVIDTEEALNALLSNLDIRGVREAHLHCVLTKLENSIRQGMQKLAIEGQTEQRLTLCDSEDRALDVSKIRYANKFTSGPDQKQEDICSLEAKVLCEKGISSHLEAICIQTTSSQRDKSRALERYREFTTWLKSREAPILSYLVASRVKQNGCSELLAKCDNCLNFFRHVDKHCGYCHITFEASSQKNTRYTEHLHECEKNYSENCLSNEMKYSMKTIPCRVEVLKTLLLCVEAAIPAEALQPAWCNGNRMLWVFSLKNASSPSDLVQLLNELERAIQLEWLSTQFEPAKEVMQSDIVAANRFWIPCTTASVAMRLLELDSALFYTAEQRQSTRCRKNCISKLGVISSKNAHTCNVETDGLKDSIKSNADKASLKEARAGFCKVTEYHDNRKSRSQGLKHFEDTLFKVSQPGLDFGFHTGDIKCGPQIAQISHYNGEKHFNAIKIESNKHTVYLCNQKSLNPGHQRLEQTGECGVKSSILCCDHHQDDWAGCGSKQKKGVEDELQEEDAASKGKEEGFTDQEVCTTKNWTDGSEDGDTDSMVEEGVDVSLHDDYDLSNGEESFSDEIDPYPRHSEEISINLDSTDEDAKVGRSDSEYLEITE